MDSPYPISPCLRTFSGPYLRPASRCKLVAPSSQPLPPTLLAFSLRPAPRCKLVASSSQPLPPIHLLPPGPSIFSLTSLFRRTFSKPTTFAFSLLRPIKCKLLATSSSPPLPPKPTRNPTTHSPLTGSTRTITTLVALALTFSKLLASKISLLPLKLVPILPNPNTLAAVSRSAFFAVISDSSALKSTGAPIAVVLAGLARWLEIYSCVLLIRVLLSWFPNLHWDRQPMSAIRDLCDPYLSLFRGIIPPLFNSLDVSPILAFLLLGMLGQIARPPRPY